MTPAQLLADMRAQHASRHNYRTFADGLWQMANDLYEGHWPQGWVKQVWDMALIAENAAWAEDKNPEPEEDA